MHGSASRICAVRPTQAVSCSTASSWSGLERGPVAHVRETLSGETVEVAARAVVNAAGPWIDEVRRLEDARSGASVTLSRGAHLVLERDGGWGAALTSRSSRTASRSPFRGRGGSCWGRPTLLSRATHAYRPTEAEDGRFSKRRGSHSTGCAGRLCARFAGVCVLPAGRARLRGRRGRRRCHRRARDGLGRRWEADDLPPDRARSAARAPWRLGLHPSIAGRSRSRAADPDVAADALRAAIRARSPLAAHLAVRTARSRRRWSPSGPLEPLADGVRKSRRRCCMRENASGRSPRTTSSAGARRSR